MLLGGGWRQSESPIVSGARGSDGTGCEVAVRGWAGRSGSTCATSLARSLEMEEGKERFVVAGHLATAPDGPSARHPTREARETVGGPSNKKMAMKTILPTTNRDDARGASKR